MRRQLTEDQKQFVQAATTFTHKECGTHEQREVISKHLLGGTS